jgi:hypothetical protein
MLSEALAVLAVVVAVTYVWAFRPLRWFLARGKGQHLPDVWIW